MTYIHHVLNLSDERWKLETLSCWRARSLPQHWPVKQTVHLSRYRSFSSHKNQLRAGAETVWRYLSDLQKCSHSYLDSAFQSVAFALQRIGFWRDVHCWLFFKLPQVEEVCQLPANNVSPLVQFVEELQRCRCRPDWVFLGAVSIPDKRPAINRRYVMCRKQEKQWGKRQRQDQSVKPSGWPESRLPRTLC